MKLTSTWISGCTLLLAGMLCATDRTAAGEAPSELVVENQHLRIILDGQNGGWRHLVDRRTNRELMDADGQPEHLWKLHMSVSGQPCEVASRDAASLEFHVLTDEQDAARIVWKDFELPGLASLRVSAVVRLDAEIANSYWQLEIDKPLQSSVQQIDFPRIPALAVQDDERLAVPLWMGQEISHPRRLLCEGGPAGRQLAWSYPGHLSMQCVAFYSKHGTGLYAACRDTNVLRKTFCLSGLDDRVGLEVWHYPLHTDRRTEHVELPYPVVIGAFQGDWFTVAERYRRWGSQQTWAQNSRLHRGNVPGWVTDTSLWIWNRGRSKNVLPPAAEFRQRLGLPVSVFWHWWHGCAYDIGFPEYLPPREGTTSFQQAVARAHDDDLHMIVYMNQRAWGLSTDSWQRERAERFAVKDPDGNIRREVYNTFTRDALVPMCLATSFWRNKYAGLAEEAVRDLGVDGIYMDQACSQLPCFDPDHNHPPGGGNTWIQGFRDLSDDIRLRCASSRRVALAGEGCGEAWLPYLDMMLALQVSRERYAALDDAWEPIPFFHAVYHPYGITYGNYSSLTMPPYDELWPAESAPEDALALLDRRYSQQFYLEQARTFVWGQQPALANFQTRQFTERPEEIDYLLRLARLRQQYRNYLLYGQFLQPPGLNAPRATLDFSRLSIYAGQQDRLTSRRKDHSLALAGAWRDQSGQVAVALASISDTPIHVTIRLNLREYELPPEIDVYRCDDQTRQKLGSFSGGGNGEVTIPMDVPARALWMLELQGNG
jgi:hypothetical protein